MTFLTGLGLLFIGLRLADIIDWSWVLVTMPIWIEFLIGFFVGFVAVFKNKTKKSAE